MASRQLCVCVCVVGVWRSLRNSARSGYATKLVVLRNETTIAGTPASATRGAALAVSLSGASVAIFQRDVRCAARGGRIPVLLGCGSIDFDAEELTFSCFGGPFGREQRQ
jgi:hypothetical protein